MARVMEKLSASLLAATSAALLYLALRRQAEPRPALVLALAYAFGTTTWMIGSQALWQHGMAELLIAGMLLAVTGPASVRATIVAGLLGGLIACNRPPDSLLAAAIGLYGVWWAVACDEPAEQARHDGCAHGRGPGHRQQHAGDQ